MIVFPVCKTNKLFVQIDGMNSFAIGIIANDESRREHFESKNELCEARVL